MKEKARTDKILIAIDPELEELIPGYLQNRHSDVEELSRSLEQQDYETIRRLGHGMKGSGAGYGLDDITEIGRRLELAGKNKRDDEVQELIAELRFYLDNLKIHFSS